MNNCKIDFSLEPTEILIEELIKRYPDGLVIAYSVPEKDTLDKKRNEFDTYIEGNFETTLYLTKCLEWEHADIHRCLEDCENDEDFENIEDF